MGKVFQFPHPATIGTNPDQVRAGNTSCGHRQQRREVSRSLKRSHEEACQPSDLSTDRPAEVAQKADRIAAMPIVGRGAQLPTYAALHMGEQSYKPASRTSE